MSSASRPDKLSLERWHILEPLLDAALDQPVSDREVYLDRACGDDADLRGELARLLSLHQRLSQEPDPFSGPAAERFHRLFADLDPASLSQALEGRYQLEGVAGRGGMALVYRARDLRHRRTVALKVLEVASNAAALRFRREIELAAGLQHPSILPVFDSGEDAGRLWYTMPFVEGESLEARLQREARLPLGETLRLLREILEGLGYAHGLGIVHRDLKPDNILLSAGHPIIADFGIAKALAGEPAQDTATTGGMAIGTPAYMAPEQIAADPAMDHRADLYAVGVIAYRLLTGAAPFDQAGSRQALLAAQLVQRPDPPSSRRPEVPSALDRLILQLLEKDPAKRPASAMQVLAELGRISADGRNATPRWLGLIWQAGLVAGVMAILTTAVVPWLSHRPANTRKRVLISRFTAAAGDPAGSRFGEAIADAIASELARSGFVEVVSGPDGVDERKSPEEQARGADADFLVSGRYDADGDSIRAQLRIEDRRAGRRLPDRGAVSVGRRDQVGLIDSLRRRTMAMLAPVVDREMEKWIMGEMPGNIEAYYAFRDGLEAMSHGKFAQARSNWDHAAALDSSYVQPMVHGISARYCLFDFVSADSLARVVARRPSLAKGDRAFLEMNRAFLDGETDRAYRAAMAMVEAEPGAELPRFFVAITAMALNRPREAIESGRHVNYQAGKFRYEWAGTGLLMLLAEARHQLGEYREELKQVDIGLALHPDNRDMVIYRAQALVGLGQTAAAESLVSRALALPRPTGMPPHPEPLLRLAGEFRYHQHPEASRRVLGRVLTWLNAKLAQAQDDTLAFYAATTLYLMDSLPQADSLSRLLLTRSPNDPRVLVLRAATAWRLGDARVADSVTAVLQANDHPLARRFVTYGLARLWAQRGDSDKAMEYLNRSLDEGMRLEPRWNHTDLMLAPLWRLPGYQALFQARG